MPDDLGQTPDSLPSGDSGGVAAGAIDQAHANGFKILLGIVAIRAI